jgi:uncharacterized protein (DUF488 family)
MPRLFCIGHSTHSFEEFLAMLRAYKISHLVDVRSVPKSRYVPWFNKSELQGALSEAKIRYTHLPELGGLRKPHPDSINQGWHNSAFRGYADYMQTPEFFLGLRKLNQLVKLSKNVAIMCAEAVPWRCHRQLIADAEIVRGVKVYDIMSAHSLREHALTPFAVVNRKKRPIQVFYPFALT